MRSARLTPAAATSTSTSPGPATGSGTVPHRSTSGPPGASSVIACMCGKVALRWSIWPLRHLVLRTPRLELRPDDDAGPRRAGGRGLRRRAPARGDAVRRGVDRRRPALPRPRHPAVLLGGAGRAGPAAVVGPLPGPARRPGDRHAEARRSATSRSPARSTRARGSGCATKGRGSAPRCARPSCCSRSTTWARRWPARRRTRRTRVARRLRQAGLPARRHRDGRAAGPSHRGRAVRRHAADPGPSAVDVGGGGVRRGVPRPARRDQPRLTPRANVSHCAGSPVW